MKLPTKRKLKGFFRRLWNTKEIYMLIFIVIGTAWMIARVADGIERAEARNAEE